MGALIPASEWLDFCLLSSFVDVLARSCQWDFAARDVAGNRWARLAGFGVWSASGSILELSFTLPGETELGKAEEQPNKG